MKLLKIFSISIFVFSSFVFVGPVFGAELPKIDPSAPKATVIAQVNLRNVKIVSQKDNVFNISFDISNREGVQSGVKYSARLIKKTEKSQITVDEFVYPEVLSLSANSTVTKDIKYTAPANLSGDFTLMVSAKNYSGLPLGSGIAGDVSLVATEETVSIISETCTTSVTGSKAEVKNTLNQGINLSPTENIVLTCNVINNSKDSISSVPTYETHFRTLYGELVQTEGGDVAPIEFTAGENKLVSLSLPKVIFPQVYAVKIYFKSGDTSSNSVVVNYNLVGLSATIQNFSLDKNSYSINDTAKVSLFLTASSFEKPITLTTQITNNGKKECAAPVSQVLTKAGLIEIPVLITANCNNPKVSIEIKDESGSVLDQQELSFASNDRSLKLNAIFGDNIIIIIIGVLVVAGIAFYFIKLKKKENETTTNETINQ